MHEATHASCSVPCARCDRRRLPPACRPPQLMHEDRSRTKACKAGPLSEYRWNRFMGVSAMLRCAALRWARWGRWGETASRRTPLALGTAGWTLAT